MSGPGFTAAFFPADFVAATFFAPLGVAEPVPGFAAGALNDASLTKQLTEITANLPPQNDAVNALIAARLKSYDPAKADEARGKAVFTATCSVCHRISVLGNLVGPQLDGIGARGAERLLEDILDPNRAVDPAFVPPYAIVVVELEEGPRLVGSLSGIELSDLRLDLPVVVALEAASDTIALVTFRPG